MIDMPSANHIHRYKKVNIGAFDKSPYWVYKCTKPACSHYIPVKLAEGKMCECNRCGEPMIIGKQVMAQSSGNPMTLPHCGDCTKKRKVINVEEITEFLDKYKTQV
jgi:hypothetical protein